jgi:hypothetical protein
MAQPLTPQELAEIGISLPGHRKKILVALKKLGA